MTIKIFTTVGVTSQAVANAISSHLISLKEQNQSFEIYFIVGSLSKKLDKQKIQKRLMEIKSIIESNVKEIRSLKSITYILHTNDPILIYEENVETNVEILVKEISKRINLHERVIVDITGGRKIMTGAALLSMYFLQEMKPEISFEIAYYWLKHFTHEYLNKELYELGFDSYKSIFTPMKNLHKVLEEINQCQR